MNWMRAFRASNKTEYLFDGISIRNGRPSNMDSLLVIERELDGKKALLAAVCDGVGSLEKGGYAATSAIKGLMGWFYSLNSPHNLLAALCDEIRTINEEILEISEARSFDTGATLSALLLVGQKYYAAHLGDSRIYVQRNGKLKQLTQDDVSELGELTQCIGYDSELIVQTAEGKIRNDVFLLCSDGLYRRMNMEYMLSQMNVYNQEQIHNAISNLVNYAEQQGEKDNISLAIVKACNGGISA